MELSALIEKQVSADRRRGFSVDFDSDAERISQLEKDLVGLVGEIGEFADLLKKVRLAVEHPTYEGPTLESATPALRGELADVFIYLMRLSVVLRGDLEGELLSKMRTNDIRYAPLE